MSEIKLLFSGDFAPLVTQEQIAELDFSELDPIIKDIDYHITNLECPLTDSELTIEKSGPVIKASPSAIEIVKKAGVNIACLANNHIFDYHEQGINDTIQVCQTNGIDTLGILNRKDGQTSYLIKELKGKKIGLLNYCEYEFSVRDAGYLGASGFDEITAFYEISVLREQVDYLIVIYHGGNEYYNLPSPALQRVFRFIADLGADAVVGHHTHVFSGHEIYKGKPLLYSLGNFFFPYHGEPETWYTGLLCKLILDDRIRMEIIGVRQDTKGRSVKVLNDDPILISQLNILNEIISNSYELNQYWADFVVSKEKALIKSVLRASNFKKAMMKLGFSHQKLMKNTHAVSMFNVLRCQSYYRLIVDSLQNLQKK